MKMSIGKINFGAGPAALPPEVLHDVSKAVWRYKNTGYSILELPHRGAEFLEIIEESKSLVRGLCGIGSDYEVLWMHGGGRMQFSMIPMNFLSGKETAGYIDSGHWAAEAIDYARYYGDIKILGSSKETKYDRLPAWPAAIPADTKYLHFTTNNTIYGTQYHNIPDISIPLIGDMSSDIFSCKRDYSRYAMFYAAAQKNIGTPGVALVVIHKSLLDGITNKLPPMLDYKAQVKENSILNTANVSGIYVSLLMLRWIKAKGIATIEAENDQKAAMLYEAIDNSKVFVPHVKEVAHRSKMNVCFIAKNEALEKDFLKLCEQNDIIGLQGHRAVGGFRVSLYNAITAESVTRLVELMKEFETKV